IAQHMPEGLTRAFASRLDRLGKVRVHEAIDGELLLHGTAGVAPGDRHLVVERTLRGLVARVKSGPKGNGHRPSVGVLFRSVASVVGHEAVGVILTGMGKDGADGLLEMRGAGAHTIAQDEESSVVFGMPKAAIEKGAADQVCNVARMSEHIMRVL